MVRMEELSKAVEERGRGTPRRPDRFSLKITSLEKEYLPAKSRTRQPTRCSSYPTKIPLKRLKIRCGGELELTSGDMGKHLAAKGIVVQKTVPYAHEQNGKSERYIRTMEEGGQALLADSGLPMSFWLDAVLTRQYLVNRLPTSTLPDDITPFEVFTNGRKPDLSHLRVWGCDCYVAIPEEIRPKAARMVTPVARSIKDSVAL